jgi:catechol 2,3-dioxygenase-like lactoylglutathione lyase family enzyme
MSPLLDIAYVRYQVTDLDLQEAFLRDFGLHRSARTANTLYMRAAGPSHHCHISHLGPHNATLGLGFLARDAQALADVATRVDRPVEDNPEPGGGQCVRFADPAGFQIEVIHGQALLPALPTRAPLAFNPASGRQRFGLPIRLGPAPAAVTRLGHAALLVADFPAMLRFYTEVLGFKPSDTYYAGSEQNVIAAFMHCGRGQTWTDHHTVALIAAQDGVNRFDHTAFEVLDLDDLVQGGEHLKARGHRHSWGVGRHIQGSQLFDYWRDPFGHKIEHWTDGDLVNDSTPVGHAPISPEELRQWAPELTPEFFA